MFFSKEIEELADSILRFCQNRLRELNNILNIENKNIFRKSINKIEKLMRD